MRHGRRCLRDAGPVRAVRACDDAVPQAGAAAVPAGGADGEAP